MENAENPRRKGLKWGARIGLSSVVGAALPLRLRAQSVDWVQSVQPALLLGRALEFWAANSRLLSAVLFLIVVGAVGYLTVRARGKRSDDLGASKAGGSDQSSVGRSSAAVPGWDRSGAAAEDEWDGLLRERLGLDPAPETPAPPHEKVLRPGRAPSRAEASEGTLQLLPGRLQMTNGHPEREIRFVRGPARQRFTLGRGSDEGPQHIQLAAPTVSRLHAWMEYSESDWWIGSLSGTNPLVINGQRLERTDPAHRLADGDELELGEVRCVFRDN